MYQYIEARDRFFDPRTTRGGFQPYSANLSSIVSESEAAQYHVQVVVAGVVVTKALFWTDFVPVFGLLVTDFGPGCYDHLNYNHLSAVHNPINR